MAYVTHFPPSHLPLYEAAVAEFGDADVYLVGCELHDDELFRDLSGFWEIFERLEERR